MAAPRDDPAALAEERACIERAQAGDRGALRPVFARWGPVLYSAIILPRLGQPADAEDVLKETLMTALDRIETFQWRDRSIYYWLRQIATNKVVDHHRRRQRGNRLAEALAREAETQPTGPPLAEAALIAEEERRSNRARVTRTLEALNPRYATALRLRLLEERSRQECAETLGVSVPTFDVVFHRAVRAFRKKWVAP